MPLDTRKATKIVANLPKLRAGRTQPMTFTFKSAAGALTTESHPVILRAIQDADPALDPSGHGADFKTEDYVMSVLTSDVPYPKIRSCVYLDLPATDPGVQLASRFLITKIDPFGMLPGADRLICALTRQR